MSLLLFGVFIITLLIGIPVAFSVMLAAISVLLAGDVSLGMVAQRMFESINSFPLIAVPFSPALSDYALAHFARFLIVLLEYSTAVCRMVYWRDFPGGLPAFLMICCTAPAISP